MAEVDTKDDVEALLTRKRWTVNETMSILGIASLSAVTADVNRCSALKSDLNATA